MYLIIKSLNLKVGRELKDQTTQAHIQVPWCGIIMFKAQVYIMSQLRGGGYTSSCCWSPPSPVSRTHEVEVHRGVSATWKDECPDELLQAHRVQLSQPGHLHPSAPLFSISPAILSFLRHFPISVPSTPALSECWHSCTPVDISWTKLIAINMDDFQTPVLIWILLPWNSIASQVCHRQNAILDMPQPWASSFCL